MNLTWLLLSQLKSVAMLQNLPFWAKFKLYVSVGVQRGLGMISESLVPGHVMPGGMQYVSESGLVSESGWCVAFAFSLNYTGYHLFLILELIAQYIL